MNSSEKLTELSQKITQSPQGVTICVIGLGYVGLPLAVAFSKYYKVIGFDVDFRKISMIRSGKDPLGVFTAEDLKPLRVCGDTVDLGDIDVFVVAVPTDIDDAKQPDLHPFKRAAAVVCDALHPGGLVVVESTVYPGCTEEVFLPIVERGGLMRGEDFWYGFSPERIVPGKPTAEKGDLNGAEHTLANTVKVVSGNNDSACRAVAALYRRIITAGVHPVQSIAVAEAAKILENTQRDLNIALMNEFALICERLGIDTQEVIDAAATKWNFLPFRPGLVGGHCIGVDPFYLAYQAQRHGFHPNVVLAGRQINDRMGIFVGRKAARLALETEFRDDSVLVLGAAFKENCEDLRNSRVKELTAEVHGYSFETFICDPLVDQDALEKAYEDTAQVLGAEGALKGRYAAVVLAVPHACFLKTPWVEFLAGHLKEGRVLVDVKGAYRHHAIMHLAKPGRTYHL